MPVVAVLDPADYPDVADDPVAAFAVLAAGAPDAALLQTTVDGRRVSIVAPYVRDTLTGVDALAAAQDAVCDELADVGVDLPEFVGGVIGYLGYDHVQAIEPSVPLASHAHPAGLPDAALLLVDTVLAYDERDSRMLVVHAVRLPSTRLDAHQLDAAYDDACDRINQLAVELSGHVPDAAGMPLEDDPVAGLPAAASGERAAASSNVADGEFVRMVEQARDHVRSGDCIQIVLSQRFQLAMTVDPLHAYRALCTHSPAPYHALLRIDGTHLVCASPERLVRVRDEEVETHPIAGTRPRTGNDVRDAAVEQELLADPKERSEHMMLVDLGRNDVGRVSEPGSVRVTDLCRIERAGSVMHLVSRVAGTLRSDLHPVDALRAAFPAGTLSGAPKRRAMERIATIEADRRGPYGGAFGCIGHGRRLDMAITIRSAVLTDTMAYVQAGAGIVAQSDPAAEEAETRAKARGVLEALALAERTSDISIQHLAVIA